MKMRIVWALVLAAGIGLSPAWADTNYGDLLDFPGQPTKGQSMYTFLKIGPSPRAVAMGEAFTTHGGDIDAMFYNPGGLGFMQGGQYSLSYTKWLVNSKLFTGALAYKIGSNVWGVSLIGARPESFEETTTLQPLGTGRTIQTSDLAIGLVFARQMTDRVSWGAHVRWIRQDLVLDSSSSWDINLGISAHTGFKSLRVAVAMKNLGKDVTVETRPYSPPIYFNFGVSGELIGTQEDPTHLTLAAETLFATDYGQRWHFGGEYWVYNMLAFRAGYKVNYDVEDFSLGFGLKHSFGERDIRLDLSYSDGGSNFDAPIRVSLGGSF